MNSTSSVRFAIEFMNAFNELFAEVDQAMVKYVSWTVSWTKKWSGRTLFTRKSYAKSYLVQHEVGKENFRGLAAKQ